MRTITLSRVMPALLTRMFNAPHILRTSSTTSPDAGAVGHVAGDRLGRAAGAADGGHGIGQTFVLMSMQATLAPAAASDWAIARPNPRPAPVTSATCPLKLVVIRLATFEFLSC